MEFIAEINDLACHSIESGDYHTALDVLNICLGCVKQLKKSRASVTDDKISHSDRYKSIAETRRRATREHVLRLLRGAKRRLTNRMSITASINETTMAIRKRKKTTTTLSPPRMVARKRRRPNGNESDYISTSEESTPTIPDREPECHFPVVTSCPATVDMPSLDKGSLCSTKHHNETTQCRVTCDSEDVYFVFRKPLRMTKFQRYRIAEQRSVEKDEDQGQIDREVELAVSSNLIFNIALSHHLIATSPKEESPSSDSDSDDDVDECDDNGCGYESSGSDESSHKNNTLQTEQRLRGALRLYELGFRVHTKRVAYVTSSPIFRSQPPSASVTLRGNRSSPTSFSRMEGRQSPLMNRLHSNSDTNDLPSQDNNNNEQEQRSGLGTTTQTDRDDELKCTTRYALALLNNCAHIHEQLGQTEKAKVFQKRLLSFLLVIVDSGESIHDIIGDDPAVDGYLKNVFDGTVFHKESAPAAVA